MVVGATLNYSHRPPFTKENEMSALLATVLVVACLFANVPTWMFWVAVVACVFDFLEFVANRQTLTGQRFTAGRCPASHNPLHHNDLRQSGRATLVPVFFEQKMYRLRFSDCCEIYGSQREFLLTKAGMDDIIGE